MSIKESETGRFSPPQQPSERPGPKGGKRQANRLKRTQALCAAALSLFLREGLGEVTIDQIVAGAGMGKSAFYRYFSSKEQLVETLLQPLDEGIAAAVQRCRQALDCAPSPRDLPLVYQGLALELGMVLMQHHDVVLLYLQESRGPAGSGPRLPVRELGRRIEAHGVGLTRLAQEHGLLRQYPARIGALTVMGAAERLLYSHLTADNEGGLEDMAQVAQELIGIILDGLRPQPPAHDEVPCLD